MKKLLSVILAALILACPLCSFAADAAQTLEWYFCDDGDYCDPWIYDYRGEVTLGENEIKFTEEEYCDYYTFNAEAGGYYYIECNCEEIEWLAFPETIKDGDAYREAEGYYISGSDIEKKAVYKLNKGETLLGIDFSFFAEADETYSVTIEYLGDTVTDIIIEEGALDNLILEYDVFNSDASYVASDIDVVFSGEKTISFPDEYINISNEDFTWVKGENSATAEFMGFEKDVIVNVCEITDLVTDVEFVNLDEYKTINTNYTDYYSEDIYGAELVFTLADGTKIESNTYESECIELNGRDYYYYVSYIYNSPDDVNIEIFLAGFVIETYKCDVTKASFAENTQQLLTDLGANIKDAMYYTRLALSELLKFYDASDFEYVISRAIWRLEYAGYCIQDIFYCLRLFTEYYI